MEQRALIAAGVVATLLCGAAAIGILSRHTHSGHPYAERSDVRAPDSTRITVEVFNATHVHGLARRGTFYLRDLGFDVVGVGTEVKPGDDPAVTVVVDRTHHPDWAQLVAKALGNARVDERPDSSRDVDLTVLLGAAWRPPAQPFYP